MTDELENDPYGDPFSDDVHDPLVYALNGTDQLYQRSSLAIHLGRQCIAKSAHDPSAIAVGARTALLRELESLATTALETRCALGPLRKGADDSFAAWATAYAAAQAALNAVLHLAGFLPTVPPMPAPDAPLPPIQNWATVSAATLADMSTWATSVRTKHGQMLVAKPSPGCGKTEAMIRTALQEQLSSYRKRVVFAARTKEMLTQEVAPRFKKAGGMFVRLHVIQGRDESTCWNYDNVKAVQEHGYAPGSAVCFRCEYHPDVAKKLRTYTTCPYYRSRQNAQNDSNAARLKLHEYPIILTTHSGYLAATATGGGRFGKFWPSDILMIDEDPTEAFEPEVIVGAQHLTLPTPPRPEDRAAHAMAKLLAVTIDAAEEERKRSAGAGWKTANGKRSAVHGPHGSAYAGIDLHKLFDRVATGHGLAPPIAIFRDVSDSYVNPATGALYGATTAALVNLIVPPRGLAQIGTALHEEDAQRRSLRRIAFEAVKGQKMSHTMTLGQVEQALGDTDSFDAAYRVRLEFSRLDGWRFVLQSFASMLDQTTNIIVGDAYANVEHYRQLFDKQPARAGDPAYVDPVTVIDHLARFPAETTLLRIRDKANISYLIREGGIGEGLIDHLARLTEICRDHEGQSVLIYGHKSLKPWIEKLFADNDNFGTTAWAYENWGGGRGKDQYGNFDAVITISDYIQNINGMLHKVNARAARDTERYLKRGQPAEANANGARIVVNGEHADIAHALAAESVNRGRIHWRLAREHERQNVNELAQAIHRVRPLRSAKRITVIGDAIPFTRDTIAASATVNPPGGPNGRGKIRSEFLDGSLTEDEAFVAVTSISERFGVWSPVFLHAFLAIELTLEGGVQDDLYKNSLSGDRPKPLTIWERHPELLAPEALKLPGVRRPKSLLERVYLPPARWQELYRLANQSLKRTKLASARAATAFGFHGRIVPSWAPKGHPGFTWHSPYSFATGHRAFEEIINCQYGPARDGKLFAPNQKPFIPF